MVLARVGGFISDALSSRQGRQQGRRLMPILGFLLSAVATVIAMQLTNTTATALMLALALD
jgi:hypothetical protein